MICVLLLEYNSIFTNPQSTVLFNEFLKLVAHLLNYTFESMCEYSYCHW